MTGPSQKLLLGHLRVVLAEPNRRAVVLNLTGTDPRDGSVVDRWVPGVTGLGWLLCSVGAAYLEFEFFFRHDFVLAAIAADFEGGGVATNRII